MIKQYLLLITLSGIGICSSSFAMRQTAQEEEDFLTMSLEEIAESMDARAEREAQEEARLPEAYKIVKNLLEGQNPDQEKGLLARLNGLNFSGFAIPTERGRTVLGLLASYPDKAKQIIEVFNIMKMKLNAQKWLELIKTVNKEGNSALHIAATLGNLTFFQEFFKVQAPVPHNMQNKAGETPLFIAAERGRLPIVQLLMQKGEDVCIPAYNGMSPLMASLNYRDSWNMAHYLLEQDLVKACIKDQDQKGNNALHMAAEIALPEDLFKSILKNSDPTQRNKAEQTPLDRAQALLAKASGPDEQEARQKVVTWLENGD